MTEIIKNICMTPILFGIQQFNYLAAQGLLVIFNLYGKRLLQTEDDLFIKSCECANDYNCYKLHPLILKKMEQDLSSSTIKIIKGVITDAEVRVPWKALLSDYTLVSIEKIDLTIDIVENQKSIHVKSLNQTVPYFSDSINIKPNQEITEIFAGIREILKKYFNFVSTEIKHIYVNVGNLVFYLEELKYQKGIITLGSLKILNRELLTCAKNCLFDTTTMQLNIDTFHIKSELIEYLPTIYLNDTPSQNKINIKIRELKYDTLESHNIDIIFEPIKITLNNLLHLIIPHILMVHLDSPQQNHSSNVKHLNVHSPILDINLEQSLCYLYRPINLNIIDIMQLIIWIKNIQKNIEQLITKIRITKNAQTGSNNIFTIENILLKIIINGITLEFFSKRLKRELLDVILEDIKILSSDLKLDATNCEIVHNDSTTSIRFFNICLKSDDYETKEFVRTELQSDALHVGITTSQILIDLFKANAWNIIEIVNKIKFLIESFQRISNSCSNSIFVTALENTYHTEEISDPITDSICDNDATPEYQFDDTNKIYLNDTKTRQTIMRVVDSNIFDLLDNIDIDVIVHIMEGSLNINNMVASDIHSKILLNNQIVLNILVDSISQKEINIKTSSIFIDPKIIEICKKIINHLSSIYDETLQVEKLFQSAQFQSAQFQSTQSVNTFVPILHDLNNLSQQLIEDYRNDSHKQLYDISLKINQINVHLFDKLLQSISRSPNDLGNSPIHLSDLGDSNFVNMSYKNIHYIKSFNKDTQNKQSTKHELGIDDIVIIDLKTKNPEWKYIIKSQVDSKFLEFIYKTSECNSNTSTRIIIFITPITISLREESVFEFLNFFKFIGQTTQTNSDKPIESNTKKNIIEHCYIYPLDIILNYNPVIVGTSPDSDIFSIHKYRIKLAAQSICNVVNFIILSQIIIDNIKKKVNPDNIMQFIPNVKIIQPYTSPVIGLLKIVTYYMYNVNNHTKVNKLTKKIAKGYGLAQAMMKMGIKNMWQIFS